MVKKTNFIQSLLILGAIAGIGFALFENREALAQTIRRTPSSTEQLTPKKPTVLGTPDFVPPVIAPPQQQVSKFRVIDPITTTPSPRAPEPAPQPFPRTPLPSRTPQRILDRLALIDKTPRVLKPEFLAPTDIINPKEFNKRKFGIDNTLLVSALDKSASDRSLEERKQIEQERARNVFDSGSISNF